MTFRAHLGSGSLRCEEGRTTASLLISHAVYAVINGDQGEFLRACAEEAQRSLHEAITEGDATRLTALLVYLAHDARRLCEYLHEAANPAGGVPEVLDKSGLQRTLQVVLQSFAESAIEREPGSGLGESNPPGN